MAFDPTLPATGVTKFGDLYAILRANFVALAALVTVESWIDVNSFGSNWVSTHQVSYMKDPMGFVHLKGQLAATATHAVTAFTLPSGYQPEQNLIIPHAVLAGGEIGTIQIGENGTIAYAQVGISAEVELDCITFKAAAV
jgi:hypothetical protein